MGLLNSNTLNDYITKTIPANARSMWQGVKRIPQDLRQLTDPAFMQGLLSQPRKPLDPNEMAAIGMDYVQPMGGLLAHTVYHGSPHKFDKFDMSKVGTGEGAQAYGHGLYFAEAPEVAKSYADDLTKMRVQAAHSQLQKHGGNVDDAINASRQEIDRLKSLNLTPETGAAKRDSLIAGQEEKLAELLAYKNQGAMNTGAFYKVDIPDESIPKMLDWDKPLSEQAPEVLSAVQKALGPIPAEKLGGIYVQPNNIELSQKLREAGIPGIRYKDAMSRGTDAGTSNFVLFDDQLPRILEVNGQPTGLLSYADEAKKAKKAKK